MAAGEDVVGNLGGAGQILEISRGRCAPDAIDSILRDMVKFTLLARTDQDIDTYLMEFDMSRRKAGARRITGGGSSGEFASVPYVQNAE